MESNSIFAVKSAINNKTPCLISLHGIMEPNLSNAQSFLKEYKIFILENFSKVFNKVQNIHAITNMEAKNLRSIFKNSI